MKPKLSNSYQPQTVSFLSPARYIMCTCDSKEYFTINKGIPEKLPPNSDTSTYKTASKYVFPSTTKRRKYFTLVLTINWLFSIYVQVSTILFRHLKEKIKKP